jgi:S1-C subfamily serine protease
VTPRGILSIVSIVMMTLGLAVAPSGGAAGSAVRTGVVEIQTRYGSSGAAGAGTGMVLTASGEVLTNNHVIRGATQIRVRVPATGRTYLARVLGYSISADVALVRLGGASGLPTVSLGNSSTVGIGDDVTAVGNAGGAGLTARTGTVTARGLTIRVGDSRSGTVPLTRVIETSADLRQGDSGGPLLDSAERVIGMNAAATAGDGFDTDGYAIPINRAKSIVARIRAGVSTAAVHVGPTPFLGVLVATRQSASPRGVLLDGVRAGAPAARAGLGRGDVLLSLNGNVLRSSSQLVALLLRFRPGDAVRLVWMDALGQRQSATVTLASGPPQ